MDQVNERPLYLQVRDNLARMITSGEWEPGMKLPSERDLSRQLGISRMTIRQATSVLEEEGLLYRVQGKGTFVAKPKVEVDARDLISFTSSMLRKGIVPSAQVLELARIPASRKIASALGIDVGQWVYHVRRLRLGNNVPMVIENSYFPCERCPGLENFDLSATSIYHLLQEEFGICPHTVYQSLEPVLATEEEARILAVEAGFPLMLITRRAYTAEGVPVEFAKDLYRGDCSRFVSKMELDG